MNTHALELKRRFVKALGRAALEYHETGFDLFHRYQRAEASCSQAATPLSRGSKTFLHTSPPK